LVEEIKKSFTSLFAPEEKKINCEAFI